VNALALKRLMDLAGASVGSSFVRVAYAVFARRIKRETEASVIFRQTRVGRNGRLFTFQVPHDASVV